MEAQAKYGRGVELAKQVPAGYSVLNRVYAHYSRRLPEPTDSMLARAKELEERELKIERMKEELERLRHTQDLQEYNCMMLLLYRYSQEEIDRAKRGEVLL